MCITRATRHACGHIQTTSLHACPPSILLQRLRHAGRTAWSAGAALTQLCERISQVQMRDLDGECVSCAQARAHGQRRERATRLYGMAGEEIDRVAGDAHEVRLVTEMMVDLDLD